MIVAWIILASALLYIYYAIRTHRIALEAELLAITSVHARAGASLPVPAAPVAPSEAAPVENGATVESDYLDMDALASRPRRAPDEVPILDLQPHPAGVYKGGAAGPHPNVRAMGCLDPGTPGGLHGDRRRGRRRQGARRSDDGPAPTPGVGPTAGGGPERRLAQRRVWLRRAEDQAEHDLVDIHEAARILSATPDTIEKWILNADLPFYMVSKGAMREKRFDRIELLGWLGAEDVIAARARARAKEE